jgi:hypothetical protein
MDKSLIDLYVNRVEVRRYHNDEGEPRVTRSLQNASVDDWMMHMKFMREYKANTQERADFYGMIDDIKAENLGITSKELRLSEYVDKEGFVWDDKINTWREA